MPAPRLGGLVWLVGCLSLSGMSSEPAIAAPRNLTASSAHVATSPSVSIAGSHRWIAWTEYVRSSSGESTRIRAQRFSGGTSEEGPITVATGRLLSPVVLTQSDGAAWFFWIEVGSGGGRLKARQRKAKAWAHSSPLSVTSTRAAHPVAARDSSDRPWIAFEAHAGSASTIQIARWTGSSFSSPTTVSAVAVPSYSPAIETDKQHGIWVVWQAYVNHNFDIFARRHRGSWGSIWPITDAESGGKYRGMHVLPTIAHGANGVVWIGWVAKGLDFNDPGTRPHLTSNVRDRRIQIRRVHPNGTRDAVHQAPVPLTLVDPQVQSKHRGPERPVLQTARGKLLVFYRLLGIEDSSPADGAPWAPWRWPILWRVWVQHFDVSSNRWLSKPLDVGQGSPTGGYPEAVALADTGSSVLVAWQRDTRKEYYPKGFAEPKSDVWVNEVVDAALAKATATDAALQTYDRPLVMDQSRGDVVVRHLGSEYRLLYGDLHSHTLHSADRVMSEDHTVEDHRRARDGVDLDFYAVTDHGSHLSHHDWYQQRSQCLLQNGVRGMTTLAGIEVTQHAADGHRNLIYDGCEGGLRSVAMQPRAKNLWDSLQPGKAMTIPHNSAVRDLHVHDALFDRLFEIYQMRGSIECYSCVGTVDKGANWKPPNPSTGFGYFQNALALGHRLGVIASPDHTGFWGVAAVYASSRGQKDLFKALSQRRTFGLSNAAMRMTLDLRADGRIMGQEYTLRGGDCPVLYGKARTDYVHPLSKSRGVVTQIKIYRVERGNFSNIPGENGQVLLLKPSKTQTTFVFHDKNCPKSGSAAYYMRAIQSDVYGIDVAKRPSIGWTSPVFVTWASGGPSRKATLDRPTLPAQVPPSSTYTVKVTVRNTGDIPWTGLEQYGLVADSDGPHTPPEVPLDPDEFVLPGRSYTFTTTVKASAADRTYHLGWQMSSPAGRFGTPAKITLQVLTGVDAGPSSDGGSAVADSGAADTGLGSDAAHVSSDSGRIDSSSRADAPAGDDPSPPLDGGCSVGQGKIVLWPFALLIALLLWHRSRGAKRRRMNASSTRSKSLWSSVTGWPAALRARPSLHRNGRARRATAPRTTRRDSR